MSTFIEVTLYLRINDADEFRRTAHTRAESEGVTDDDLAAYLDPDEMSLGDCARMIFDPGMSPNGCSILDSSADESTDTSPSDE